MQMVKCVTRVFLTEIGLFQISVTDFLEGSRQNVATATSSHLDSYNAIINDWCELCRISKSLCYISHHRITLSRWWHYHGSDIVLYYFISNPMIPSPVSECKPGMDNFFRVWKTGGVKQSKMFVNLKMDNDDVSKSKLAFLRFGNDFKPLFPS